MRKWCALGLLSIVALLSLLVIPPAALAIGPGDEVVISTPYPWVVAEKGKAVTFSLEINNRGKSYQELDLQVADGPANWKPIFKDRGYTIRKVIVPPEKSQTLDFQAEPPADAKASDYAFSVKALATNGATVSDLQLKVSLADKVSAGLKLSTQYPNLRGQAGSTFSFKVDMKNDAGEDRPVNLSANAPQGWEVTFKPAFDSKQVSTIRMKAGDSQGVDIDVAAPQKVEAGEYSINFQASAGTDRDEMPLKVVVLGNYRMSLDTASGQLNTKATVDQASSVTLVLKNAGASTLQNITLSASKPDGWDVTFNPEKIDSLPPEQSRQVTASIKPGARALAGDYMVRVSTSAGQASDNKDLRVTVETPTTWGWAGIAVIVVVLGGLGLMFARLSRR